MTCMWRPCAWSTPSTGPASSTRTRLPERGQMCQLLWARALEVTMGLGDLFEGAAKGVWHGYEHVSEAAWNIAKPVVDSTIYWGKNSSPWYNAATGGEGYDQIGADATSLGKGVYTGG